MLSKVKNCSRCCSDLLLEFFPRNRKSKDGRYSQCKLCVRARNEERRKRFPNEARDFSRRTRKMFPEKAIRQRRESRLRRAYGLTESKFREMSRAQKGKCAVCDRRRRLCVDHDHDSGKVRGLLCRACNVGLGIFEDSRFLLQKAACYLALTKRG